MILRKDSSAPCPTGSDSASRRGEQAFPCQALRPFVDRYWTWEAGSSQSTLQPRFFPGTGMELIFHYGPPFNYRLGAGELRQAAPAHVMCLRETSAELFPAEHTGFLSVRLRSGAFNRFCPTPAGHLTDGFTDARDLFGVALGDMELRIAEAGDFFSRVALVEAFLLECFTARAGEWDERIFAAAQQLYYGYAEGIVDSALALAGVGIRQFQRRFQEDMGMGPRQFIKISRFHHAVRSLLLNEAESLLEVALQHGYYDQSHCIRDFRMFASMRPSDFLPVTPRMTHFYNTSRPAGFRDAP